MTPTSIILERPILNKFTLYAALDELLWIDSQLPFFAVDSDERKELYKYRSFVESHVEVPKVS